MIKKQTENKPYHVYFSCDHIASFMTEKEAKNYIEKEQKLWFILEISPGVYGYFHGDKKIQEFTIDRLEKMNSVVDYQKNNYGIEFIGEKQ